MRNTRNSYLNKKISGEGMNDYKNELKKIKSKAEKSRQAHFDLAEKKSLLRDILHYITLILSSFVAILTFADYQRFLPIIPNLTQDNFVLGVGFLASFVFLLTVTEEFKRWGEEAQQHLYTGKQLTSLIRDCDSLIKNESLLEGAVTNIREKYILINELSPPIPDKEFLKAKQRYLNKRAISEYLDEHPHLTVGEAKKRILKGRGDKEDE
ncbi:hypothetical protein MM300_10855 [Evansella sp. LMS18]|uniref:hypothetical protein n=1 Tax=Evansella sp. LMS18 TaxID=2924033 RepID=UPI0020D1A536|nr:hypothetical protein [Evansella sp. LMS18]UTR12732.1 hypothetical protein MM300_10855 [Evansella sp. LMS18]